MPPKTRVTRRPLKALQEEEEEENEAPATAKSKASKAAQPDKNPDTNPVKVPDSKQRSSKPRATGKAKSTQTQVKGKKQTAAAGGGGGRGRKKKGEMALGGRKRKQAGASAKDPTTDATKKDLKSEEAKDEEEESKEDSVPPSKRRKDVPQGIEETDRAVVAKGIAKVVKSKVKKSVKIRDPSPMEEEGEGEVEEEEVAAPISHFSHLTAVGEVMVMGQGDMGQLGLGEDMVERKKPTPVGGALAGLEVIQVMSGGMHTVALTKDGRVFTWGCNDEGALGREVGEDGEEFEAGEVGKLTGVKIVQVSAGDSHTAALTLSGAVYCWGVFRDSNGAFGLVHSTPSFSPELIVSSPYNRAVKIASGSDHVVYVTEHGDVYTFGCAEQGQLGRVPECFSSRGGRKGVGLLLHPDIVRYRYKKGVGKPKFMDVFCGPYHTFALTQDGRIFAWGLNNYGQLGSGDLTTRYQPEQLKGAWLEQRNTASVNSLDICGGQHHTVFTVSGKVFTCGRREYGRLGLGEEDSDEPDVPTQVGELDGVRRVSAGGACSFAVTDTGELYSWGMGTNLQLGTGEEEDVWRPGRVQGKKIAERAVLTVSSGGQHVAVLVAPDDSS